MPLDTTQRTTQEEALDDFDLAGSDLRDALDKIATINQWLGGNRITLNGIDSLIRNYPKEKTISVIDIGCGNGDMCRAIADFAKQKGRSITVLGIDANRDTIDHAKACSKAYPTVSYAVMNVFDKEFAGVEYDIAVCTLTLHHFPDQEIRSLMSLLVNKAKRGIVINDLHRSALAYRLFQLICFVFRLSDLSREDGLISILRGFKKDDLVGFSELLQVKNYRIRWKWAFRYQWIIKTNYD
ncbi:hypothetical protein GCM10028805_64000 [Spirosoma harenae]